MLYNLVLIDDEDWILSGIQNAIEWEEVGFRVSGAFTNGKDAVEYIKKDPPHAILTDIKMPIQDGISLVRELRGAGFTQLEVVFLSGYDDFELAQSSLRLGAVDYILKPSAPEQIMEVFAGIKTRLDERFRMEKQSREVSKLAQAGLQVFKDVIFNSVLNGNEASFDKFLNLYSDFAERESESRFKIVSVALAETLREDRPGKEALERLACLRLLMKSYQYVLPKVYIIKNQFSFSLAFSDCEEAQIRALIHEIAGKVRKDTQGILVTAESGEYRDFHMIMHAYEKSLDELFRLNMTEDACQLYMKLGDDVVLKASMEDCDQQVVLWCLKNWMIRIEEMPVEYRCRLIRRLIYSMCIYFLQYGRMTSEKEEAVARLYEVLQKSDYEPAKEAVISFVKAELLVQGENGRNAHMCQAVGKYISRNYAEEITLNELAEKFYISPNYLGTLFKRNMGMGIREYQTNVRLDQADALMKSGKFKLYQAAQMVGYPNYEYFRKIYCRYRGKNPSESI